MAATSDKLKNVRQRSYLARDFDSLRASLLENARQFYPDRIRDFSESSVGGMFLDLAAQIGDVTAFYLDHQYSELNYETAVEPSNIERLIRTSGVPIVGAAPAIVPVTVFIEVPAVNINNDITVDETMLPVLLQNCIFVADNGVEFVLLEDIDFASKRSDGTRFAEQRIGKQSASGVTQTFILALTGICISGRETSETVSVDTFTPFRKVNLSNANVTEIVSVTDGNGNTYYKVEDLTHDVVYKNVLNTAKDNDLVKDAMKIIPAPYRFIANTDLSNRRTTLTFGGGSANTLEDDVIPDPSEFAISFPYSKTFSRVAVNPEKLLQTKTLGVIGVNTTISITYRYGGGLDNNVAKDNIRTAKTLKMFFTGNPQASIAARIKNSIECTNRIAASGGEDQPTVDDLRQLIPAMKNSQERIVTRQDLLARVYTLPSNFGRVFRAAIRSNPNNPLATQLFIVSRSPDLNLITSPDTLKTNLVKYLNPYRMISDAVDVLDAQIINLSLLFEVVVDPTLNKAIVLQNILTKLQTTFDIKNFHIDQPIVISEVVNTIFSTQGVIALNKIEFKNLVGLINNVVYSSSTFDVNSNLRQNILYPTSGGIFEIRDTTRDIIGRAVV